ncbi:MAG: hypothetical protein CMJ83_02600 [Planctomycetes bacterium]|nr:hypothetical protein [Planctomycetota bacterium]
MARAVDSVFLLTDFGAGSHYVGVVKAVILTVNSRAIIHDLSHRIRPGDVREAGYVLEASLPHLPPRSLVVAVVDPGVGSDRRIACFYGDGPTILAPDNGLLTGVATDGSVRVVEPERLELAPPASHTFHGRDVFAPVAAKLSLGLDPRRVGSVMRDWVAWPEWHPIQDATGAWSGTIVHVDAFGNLITNLDATGMGEAIGRDPVAVGGATIQQWGRTFSHVAPGKLLAYIGSTGHVEIAVRDGSAAARLGVENGAAVRLGPLES